MWAGGSFSLFIMEVVTGKANYIAANQSTILTILGFLAPQPEEVGHDFY